MEHTLPPKMAEVMSKTQRAIFNQDDLHSFWESDAYRNLVDFVKKMGDAAAGKPMSAPVDKSPMVDRLIALLKDVDGWVDDIPPLTQPMRYGNKAFRILYNRLAENVIEMVARILPESLSAFANELSSYIMDSFGNSTRIDYGTGHECTFVVFLNCLYRLGALVDADLPGTVLKVFPAYILTVRHIQTTYWLEPAGSHGVWSLDDYQMLVFYFGSCQLLGQEEISPSDVQRAEALERHSSEYMYFHAIQFIMKVKTGQFGVHSPMLSDISQLKTWDRVRTGMFRMFEGEVLRKLPVIQHFRFGSIFKCQWVPSSNPDEKEYARLTME